MADTKLDKVYDPKSVEEKWLNYWEKMHLFRADPHSRRASFSMVIPPPNVTGSLHMGHALNNTIQDIIARYKRMKGFDVLWIPGMDHAGIATQNVVERQLAAEGIDRHTIGRDAFVDRVWKWKADSGGMIIKQLKRLGASCDWSREQFTLSPLLSSAVKEVFVRLYDDGLVYRDEKLVNWCPRCLTALSDIEVEHEDIAAYLYHIKYPLADDKNEFITVATTRPETMLGDVAVAVHPEDERFIPFTGRGLLLPLTEREIPLLSDDMVDMDFGTGAVKITPSHDFNDFEMAERHNLDRVSVFNERGEMNESIPDVEAELMSELSGMRTDEARRRIVAILDKRGFLSKEVEYKHSVGRCYRCKTTIEPYLSPQWFVRAKPLARQAVEAVKEGRTRFIPVGWEKTYFEWMKNIKDWCISRQIWWGHKIPASYCLDCNRDNTFSIGGELKFTSDAVPIVARDEPEDCPVCGGGDIIREEDVLDTWFSSALWPFSTLGWPGETEWTERYYPTSLLVTGFDIIFFWVARMLMMGIRFMGQVPFRDVYIHALVKDAEGKKMSKSRGNVVDPLFMMDRYGTDAFRFTLAAMSSQGRDIKLSEERIAGYRNFCNKIWNLARFALIHISGSSGNFIASSANLLLPDKWILKRLNVVIECVTGAFEEYRFNEAANAIYQFIWHELCDWYLEIIKPALKGEEGEERSRVVGGVLVRIIGDSMKLLHPVAPFITEEVWSALPSSDGGSGDISREPFPVPLEVASSWDTDDMFFVIDLIRAVRSIRSEMNISPALLLTVVCVFRNEKQRSVILSSERYILAMARLKYIKTGFAIERPEYAASALVRGMELFVPLKGVVDLGEEAERLRRRIKKLDRELLRVKMRISNKDFIARAPAEVVEESKDTFDNLSEKSLNLRDALGRIENIAGSIPEKA